MTKKPAGSRRPRSTQFKPGSNRRPVISVSATNNATHKMTCVCDVPIVASPNLEDWKGTGFSYAQTTMVDSVGDPHTLIGVVQTNATTFVMEFAAGTFAGGGAYVEIPALGYHVVSQLGVLGPYGTLLVDIGSGIY